MEWLRRFLFLESFLSGSGPGVVFCRLVWRVFFCLWFRCVSVCLLIVRNEGERFVFVV